MNRPVVLILAIVMASACGGDPNIPMYAEDHPRIYLPRNRERLAAALEAGGPAAVRFRDVVDRWVDGGEVYAFEAWNAALVGQLTGDPRYCAAAVEEIGRRVDDELAAVASGDLPQVAGDSYLEIGPLVGDVLLVYDWCFDVVPDDQREGWLVYADQAVWNVWHHETAEWGGREASWSGWSVDNPSNNYYYSFLRATMLLGLAAHGEIDGATEYLAFVRDDKIGGQVIPTFERDLVGGGSREGTGYGVAMMRLFELYDLWHGSTGEDVSRLTGHTRASLLYFLHTVVPTRDRFAPSGDHARDTTAMLFDYHRNYVQILATLFADDRLAPRARWLLANSTVTEMDEQFMAVYDFLYAGDGAMEPIDDLGRAYFGAGAGQLYNRSGWDVDATWVNLTAGPYTESHAHQDQGSIMIYKGEWLAYDPNVDSASGINQDVDNHNLVRIVDAGGATVRQHEPTTSQMVALHRGDGWLHGAADVTAAYDGASEVTRVQREIVHLEPDTVVVFDRVDSAPGTTQVWQLSSPIAPVITGSRTVFTGATSELTVERLLPAGAVPSAFDWTSNGEYSGGHRLDATVAGGVVRHLNLLWTGHAVSTFVPDDAAGRIGVTITFDDGRTATVRFGADGVDGTIELRDAGGQVTDSATLAPGVDAMPE